MDYNKIIELVKTAGKFVFDEALKSEVSSKGEADFVTAVDLKISTFMKENLAVLTPDIGFMSEEEENRLSDRRWILDPIDGTTNLVYNYNISSVSLALFEDGVIKFGVIYNPFNEDIFVAKLGEGAYYNGKKMGAAPDRNLPDCLIEFGAGSTKKQFTEESFALAKEVFTRCLDIRRICSSALAIAYVAAGKINGYFERSIKPWDYAAASLLLKECGCICGDWNGVAIQYDKPSSFVCGTPKAYKFLLETISKVTK